MVLEVRRHGLTVALINTPAGDMAAGELGLGVLPGRQAELDAAFNRAIAQATALGVPLIHFLAGYPGTGQDVAEIDATFLQNMIRAADAAAAHGLSITLEPL